MSIGDFSSIALIFYFTDLIKKKGGGEGVGKPKIPTTLLPPPALYEALVCVCVCM